MIFRFLCTPLLPLLASFSFESVTKSEIYSNWFISMNYFQRTLCYCLIFLHMRGGFLWIWKLMWVAWATLLSVLTPWISKTFVSLILCRLFDFSIFLYFVRKVSSVTSRLLSYSLGLTFQILYQSGPLHIETYTFL